MLVPRHRLILWVALIVLPFAAAGATLPGALLISWLAIGLLIAAAILDAWFGAKQLTGIRVALPELVRLQKDRAGELQVRIFNDSLASRVLRVGLGLPPELSSPADDRTTLLPAAAAVSRLEWPLTATRRGQYLLEKVYLETPSPLGFWSMRTSQSVRCEIRVYPNLLDERKHVAAVFLRRGQHGTKAQRTAGQGREFDKLREYVAGDSYDEIHWKASARRGHAVTKVFQVEQTHEVYVIIDASRLSGRTLEVEGKRTNALERFVSAALILGAAAEQQGDQFGLITFSDRVLSFFRAKNGPAHFDACRDRLYTLQPQGVTPDFEELCSFIRIRLRKRALLVFLTALDDPMLAESFGKSAELICRQHLLLVNLLQPAGAAPLFGNPDVEQLDDLYEELAGHLRWRELRELRKKLRRHGIRLELLDPGAVAGQLVRQHAEVKGRQLV
ncbi:MAG TPA: DUF58 domain-containing protein [Chthoniobacteraceae bacterium]|jgi:uncharacterized protein (DUF58 family)